MTSYGDQRLDLLLQPVSGKALPVYRGEVLRIAQVEGEQCVDFNSFNLHDYKERMDVGSTRGTTGFRPVKGDIMFSNPPRYRPMVGILEMALTCQADLLGRSCHATQFEARFGFDIHTNCQDTLAECIGEYGLTPDDVHDSFNLWMNTEWGSTGRWWIEPNTGQAGEYVDLLALFDILAVPAICGGGDVGQTSNFSFKSIQIQVFEPSNDTMGIVDQVRERHGSYRNQRTVNEFRVKEIRTQRELRHVPGWEPQFVNYPIQDEGATVELTPKEHDLAVHLQGLGFGGNPGEVVRRAVMHWCLKHRMHNRRVKIPLL